MIYQFHRPRPTQVVIIRTIDKIQESRRWDFLRYRVTPKPLVKESESSDSLMYIHRQRNKVA